MGMTTAEKIRLIVGRRGVTMGEVAEGTGQTRQNFSNKLKRDDFKESELSQIAEFLSLPSRERGLKSKYSRCHKLVRTVAPFRGTKVEIRHTVAQYQIRSLLS